MKFKNENVWTVLSLIILFISVFIGATAGVSIADVTVVNPGSPGATAGQSGAETQVVGQATTVSNAAEAGGGVGGDNLIQPDIDDQIFLIGTDETVLEGLMRKCKKKQLVSSWEVDHYKIDERKASVLTTSAYAAASANQASLYVSSDDATLFQEFDTILVKGVDGYKEDGSAAVSGSDLMLFIVGKDSSGLPIARAINGPKTNTTDAYCKMPAIPSGTKLIFLANACAETQKEVAPDMVVPVPTRVYLQKMIMNQIISEYFDKQKKRIPFQQATIAEAAVKQFRRKSNRTLWVGRKSKFKVQRGKMGDQYVYTTEGMRWQFTKQYDHIGEWTFKEIIALAKMKFTGQDCSKQAWWLMGKDLLESIQNIDFTKHKDITMTADTVWGYEVTKLHTVFGDFFLKHEPTLDYLGYENSGGIIDLDGLVRYYMKNEEASSEKIEGEEAERKCIISINALALKGNSHIWVDGKGEVIEETVDTIVAWTDDTNAPTDLTKKYLLTVACTAISDSKAGEVYYNNGTSWVKYTGTIIAGE